MNGRFLFTKRHYLFALAGVIVIAIGYLLMIGGGAEDPTAFSEDVFSFRRITLSPIVITIGFIILLYTIMMRDKTTNEAADKRK